MSGFKKTEMIDQAFGAKVEGRVLNAVARRPEVAEEAKQNVISRRLQAAVFISDDGFEIDGGIAAVCGLPAFFNGA